MAYREFLNLMEYLSAEGDWVHTGICKGYVIDPRDGKRYDFDDFKEIARKARLAA